MTLIFAMMMLVVSGSVMTILLVAAFLLTLGAGLWGIWATPPAPEWGGRVHIGWLGVSLYFLSLILSR